MPIKGTLGTLLLAKRRTLIPAVRPHLEALTAAGIHVSPELIALALRAADE